jgi:hypothetical protein
MQQFQLVRIFLVNKLNKNHKVIRLYRNFAPLVWTEFETRLQLSGLSFKLGPMLFVFGSVYYFVNFT